MATFDQLLADKRAVIELLLQRGRSYDELSEVLGVPRSKVRKIACDALVELSPLSAGRVDAAWRSQVADYILRQQTAQDAIATHAYMRRSEPARTWAHSLVDSLQGVYEDGPPVIPEGRRGTPSDNGLLKRFHRWAAAAAILRRDGSSGLRDRGQRVSVTGRCAVCSSTTFTEVGEKTAEALGWRVSGDVRLCPACQRVGWQLPEGARLPHLPSDGRAP